MMVLGPKHVGAVLVFQCVKFYISALVGIITGWLDNMHGVAMEIGKICLRHVVTLVYMFRSPVPREHTQHTAVMLSPIQDCNIYLFYYQFT